MIYTFKMITVVLERRLTTYLHCDRESVTLIDMNMAFCEACSKDQFYKCSRRQRGRGLMEQKSRIKIRLFLIIHWSCICEFKFICHPQIMLVVIRWSFEDRCVCVVINSDLPGPLRNQQGILCLLVSDFILGVKVLPMTYSELQFCDFCWWFHYSKCTFPKNSVEMFSVAESIVK